MKDEMMKKYQGCLLGLAIGDALGWPVEFIKTRADILTVTDGKGVTDLPLHAVYTDDTQMTICVANALLRAGESTDSFMGMLSEEFVEWFHQQEKPENRRAPGSTCMAACKQLAAGTHWDASGIEESMGCGSAMRTAPIGLYFQKVEDVIDYAICSSRITHPHELALCGAVGNALLTHLAIKDEPVGVWASELVNVNFNAEFKAIIKLAAEMAANRENPDFVLSEDCLGEGWLGHEAVASALYCCMMHPDSYKDAVLLAANAVGDSDSIACIAGGWMGARLGIDKIPYDWIERIENNSGLIKLADKLWNVHVVGDEATSAYSDEKRGKTEKSNERSAPDVTSKANLV